ncbi:MAG TPA: hypothetical protein VEQ10_13395 [Vicinamibacteria bacterium]|nr:hypothetical protein [Vicinamibacteria bacterium]
MTAALVLAGAMATAAAALPATGVPAPVSRVALLPFDDFSGASEARAAVAGLITAGLWKKGYQVIQGEPVEQALEARRIRYLESLTADSRRRLLADLGVSALVTGALYGWVPEDHPSLSLSVRVVGPDGATLFWNLVGLSADETEGMLGLGQLSDMDALAREAVTRLLRGLPAPGAAPKSVSVEGKPWRLPAPRTFRSEQLEKGRLYRVVPLPVDNQTSVREASRDVSDVLHRRLAQSGLFDVVEPAELRAAILAEKVRGFADMNPDNLRKLGRRLGTPLFLRSTLTAFRPGGLHGANQPPQVALELQLVDIDSNRLLWTSQHARRGSDYMSLFERGAITDVVALADRTAAEMVRALLDTRPTAPKAAASRPPRGPVP